jgi:hypothetical protein
LSPSQCGKGRDDHKTLRDTGCSHERPVRGPAYQEEHAAVGNRRGSKVLDGVTSEDTARVGEPDVQRVERHGCADADGSTRLVDGKLPTSAVDRDALNASFQLSASSMDNNRGVEGKL